MIIFTWCAGTRSWVYHRQPVSLDGPWAAEPRRAVLVGTTQACALKGMSLKGARVAVHGFGNAGANIARLVAGDGARVVAACDSKAGVFAENGIDVQAALQHKAETSSLSGLPGAKEMSPEDIVGVECDILLPSALENATALDRCPMKTNHAELLTCRPRRARKVLAIRECLIPVFWPMGRHGQLTIGSGPNSSSGQRLRSTSPSSRRRRTRLSHTRKEREVSKDMRIGAYICLSIAWRSDSVRAFSRFGGRCERSGERGQEKHTWDGRIQNVAVATAHPSHVCAQASPSHRSV